MLVSPGMKRGEEGEAGIRGGRNQGSRGADGKNRDARAQSHWSWHSVLGTKDKKGKRGGEKAKARVLARDRRGRGIGRKTPNEKKKEDSNNKVTKLQEK